MHRWSNEENLSLLSLAMMAPEWSAIAHKMTLLGHKPRTPRAVQLQLGALRAKHQPVEPKAVHSRAWTSEEDCILAEVARPGVNSRAMSRYLAAKGYDRSPSACRKRAAHLSPVAAVDALPLIPPAPTPEPAVTVAPDVYGALDAALSRARSEGRAEVLDALRALLLQFGA